MFTCRLPNPTHWGLFLQGYTNGPTLRFATPIDGEIMCLRKWRKCTISFYGEFFLSSMREPVTQPIKCDDKRVPFPTAVIIKRRISDAKRPLIDREIYHGIRLNRGDLRLPIQASDFDHRTVWKLELIAVVTLTIPQITRFGTDGHTLSGRFGS